MKNLEILGKKLLTANPGTISLFCGGIEEINEDLSEEGRSTVRSS
jgi:hypothetical protein